MSFMELTERHVPEMNLYHLRYFQNARVSGAISNPLGCLALDESLNTVLEATQRMDEHLIRRLFEEQLRGWGVSGAKSNPLGCLAAASAVDGRSSGIVIHDQVHAQLVPAGSGGGGAPASGQAGASARLIVNVDDYAQVSHLGDPSRQLTNGSGDNNNDEYYNVFYRRISACIAATAICMLSLVFFLFS
jgi:hypothetical protein